MVGSGRAHAVSEPAGKQCRNGYATVSGTATVEETLTSSNSSIADTDGLPSRFAYQCVRVDGSYETDISGATSGNYTLTDDDNGKTVKVVISFTDKFSVEETVTSDPLSSSGTVQTSTSRSVANAAPTASNNRVMTAEDTAYTFSATDKGYLFSVVVHPLAPKICNPLRRVPGDLGGPQNGAVNRKPMACSSPALSFALSRRASKENSSEPPSPASCISRQPRL